MIKKLIHLIAFVSVIQLLSYEAISATGGLKSPGGTLESEDALELRDKRENFIIVADAPNDIEWNLIMGERETHRVIALDGAANKFQAAEETPDVILGDFDSITTPEYWGIQLPIDDNSPSYVGNYGVRIVPARDQNFTDLEKGIKYCDENGARSIYILNAHGGRMDHELGNYSVLRRYYNVDRPIRIRTPQQTLEFFRGTGDTPAEITIRRGETEYCGIVGFPAGVILTMGGFEYNADDYPLGMLSGSTCNRIAEGENQAVATVTGEALVMHPN